MGLSKKRGVQWEGKSKGKSKRINRKNRVKMLAERQTRKERSCSYTFMYMCIYIHTHLFQSLILISCGTLEEA